MDATSLPELFDARVKATPAGTAYRQFEPATGRWVDYTWSQVAEEVAQWRAALSVEGLEPGARVAILVSNGVTHVCADQAALALGLVPVPLHVIDNPDNLAYVLKDSGTELLVVDSAERWRALAAAQTRLPDLRRVVYVTGDASTEQETIAQPLREWLGVSPCPVPATLANINPEQLATIVYTSGTTGRPKGVMLTHRNIMANLGAIQAVMALTADDVFLSFLPLSHTLERTVGYYLPIAVGATVAFARSIPQLMEDFQLIRPTILVSVPRIYERALIALRQKLEHVPLGMWLFRTAVREGWRRFEYQQGRMPKPAIASRLLDRLCELLLGRAVRARFGGRLRAAVAGGAALSSDTAEPLLAFGIPLLQGYGMTESAPVIACNTLADNDPATVGRALPGTEVRLGDDEELLARSDSVMPGYWQRPADTAHALEPDGWLHTGDQAEIRNGHIRIKGRIKDILVTSTGEKIAPVDLESAITTDPVFEQAMVLGEHRPFIAALVVLNQQQWAAHAQALGLNPHKPADLQSPLAREWALARIAERVKSFPAYATPRAVYLTLDPWTVANALLTPTLKPKRLAITTHLDTQIAALYAGH